VVFGFESLSLLFFEHQRNDFLRAKGVVVLEKGHHSINVSYDDFAFVGDQCCLTLDFVFALWIMTTFYTLLTSLSCTYMMKGFTSPTHMAVQLILNGDGSTVVRLCNQEVVSSSPTCVMGTFKFVRWIDRLPGI
jgi:hypothetical protein